MEALKHLSVSVVVTANDHNPTVLQPYFLKAAHIVPDAWEPSAGTIICTPPFSAVKYPSGISIQVDPSRLQVTDIGFGDNPEDSQLALLTENYVAALPYVSYNAVGINFSSVWLNEDPEKYLIDRFIRLGDWSKAPSCLSAAGLRLVYPTNEGERTVISLDPGTARINEQEAKAVLLGANYHYELRTDAVLNEAISRLKIYKEIFAHYRELYMSLLGLEAS